MRRKIGIREAKEQFSRLIRTTREDRAEWIITDRGRPAARMVPIADEDVPVDEMIRRLEERGWLLPRSDPQRKLPPPLPLEPGLAQRMLQEDRGHGA